jgi:hypothetical protein
MQERLRRATINVALGDEQNRRKLRRERRL